MKIERLIAAVALLMTAAIVSISAQQQRPAAPAGTTPVAPQTPTVAIPDSKMAIIYTEAFFDQKNGIAKFTSLVNTLNREFQPRQTELTGLQQRIEQLTKEITDQRAVASPQSLQQKQDQLDQLKRDFQRKGEDAEAAYNRRRQEILTPLEQEIGRALEIFAKARGITMIVDRSQVPISYVSESIDITRAFIDEFNAKNPATASVAPATPARP